MRIRTKTRAAAGLFAGLASCGLATGGRAATDGPAPGLLGAPPLYREIKDWVIACDNTRACEARFVPAQDGEDAIGSLILSREAGPMGPLVVELDPDVDGSPDPSALRLDGRKLAGAWSWTLDPKTRELRLTGASARAFVRAIVEGARLDYRDRDHASHVSLSGLKAALLAMDEDQGRLDGETALARPGPRPASATPAALPVPHVRAAPTAQPLAAAKAFAARVRVAQAAVLRAQTCDSDQASQDQAWALDSDRAIILLGCGMGAYQGWVLAFVAPRAAPERARPLILQGIALAGDAGRFDGAFTQGDWDPKLATFSFSAKGRGVGDCGQSGAWVYDGKTFRLSEYNNLGRCGGTTADWPTLYRTRVVVAPPA